MSEHFYPTDHNFRDAKFIMIEKIKKQKQKNKKNKNKTKQTKK